MQVFTDQSGTWFGMELAARARDRAAVPRNGPAAVPGLIDGERTLAKDDLMSGTAEDPYPDRFGLAHGIDGGSDLTPRHGCRPTRPLPTSPDRPRHDVATDAYFLGNSRATSDRSGAAACCCGLGLTGPQALPAARSNATPPAGHHSEC